MSDIRVKCCPLLGCSYSMGQSVIRGNPPIISASLIPCVGENCINFTWDCEDGFCRYFQKYTNHDRRKERCSRMTREEAIRDIEECVIPYVGGISLRMAVEALKEQRPHGKIITDEDGNTSCSECGQTSVFGNFCYNCGVDLREGEAE